MTPAARGTLFDLPDPVKRNIAECLERSARLELRDRAIRQAIAIFSAMSPTGAAKALAGELAASGAPGTPRGDLVGAILALNKGKPLRWKQIHNLTR